MARSLKTETVANLSQRFANLRSAITDMQAEKDSLTKGLQNNSLTEKGIADAMTRVAKCQTVANAEAEYLANVFRVWMSAVGAESPEAIVGVFSSLKDYIPNIVEVVNVQKETVRETLAERKQMEIREKAEALLASLNEKKAK